jgi:hypothetical protein
MGLMDTALGALLNRMSIGQTKYLWRKTFSDPVFKKWILDLIRIDQLFEEGIDSDGDVIGYYSYFTELMNPEKKEGTPYTLLDSGDFYESMIITIGKDYFEIDADPIKIDSETGEETNLFYKYGENIIGITEENLQKLRQEIKERYRKEYAEYIKR